MTGDDRSRLEARLRAYRAPDEEAAEARSLELARAALGRRSVAPAPRRGRRLRLAFATAAAVIVAGIALTPAGAAVRDLIEDALTVERVRQAPLRLPSEGSILTVNRDGAWIASEGGNRRFLGSYRQAAFSPRGLNVAVAAGRELSAVDRLGELQWRLRSRGRVADPAWAPSGLRIAYRSGADLRIVEGDGEPDRRLAARGVAAVPPAWKPVAAGKGPRDVLAYVGRDETVRIVDAAGGSALVLEPVVDPRLLQWLDDGRLVVAGRRQVALVSADGALLERVEPRAGGVPTAIDAEPDAGRVALATTRAGSRGVRSSVSLIRFSGDGARQRPVFSSSGPIAGLAFSPDGEWLGFGWPEADSWLFARPVEHAKLVRRSEAISDISSRFEDGVARAGPAGFPAVVDWERLAGGG